jgi:outer membrane protein assembly factor BamB
MAADWPTFGGDPQRTGSVEDGVLSPAKAVDLELKWSTQLDNVPLALNSLMAPVVANNVATSQGSKTVVYVAGSSDTFFALDSQDGKILWTRTFDSSVVPDDDSFYLCPNSVNATPTIDKVGNLIYTIARDGKLYGLDLGIRSSEIRAFPIHSRIC